MARPTEYETIKIKPTELSWDSQKIIIKPLYIKAPIKSQNNGGARISISQDYVDHEAIIFITNKKVRNDF
ncbi:unnamed protein product [marine sediment metagenome]|uniref:Uncharacterized protein n=1 Tax=marine sediment metagenome TaxID=412755 RepID=X0WNA6_9ZZZZ